MNLQRHQIRANVALSVLLAMLLETPAQARGRKPDADKFPDYNKLELAKPMPPPDQISSTPASPSPTPAMPMLKKAPSGPLPSSDLDTPRPPPKAIPVPANDSEPPMPEEPPASAPAQK